MSHYDLLLVGAGHAHLGVLRRWVLVDRPPGRIALVDAAPRAWSAAMLPALLAGRQGEEDGHIELGDLCRAAKVDLVIGKVRALVAQARRVCLDDGRELEGDWLSLNVGGRVAPLPQQGEGLQVLAVKPFAGFLDGWRRWRDDPQPLTVLGGGAAGVELALALAGQAPSLALFCEGALLARYGAGLRLRALGHLRRKGVQVREFCPVERIEDDQLISGDKPVWRTPRLLLATGVQPWPWFVEAGLACDASGFVQVSPALQSLAQPSIFAAGDCASLAGTPRDAAAAVGQAGVLAANLNAVLRGQPLRAYRPRAAGPLLLSTGDGGALLAWRGWSAGGRFYGRWKDFLDRGFVQRHRLPG